MAARISAGLGDRCDRPVAGAFQRGGYIGVASRVIRRIACEDARKEAATERVAGTGGVDDRHDVSQNAHAVLRRCQVCTGLAHLKYHHLWPESQVEVQHCVGICQAGQCLHVLDSWQRVVGLCDCRVHHRRGARGR